MKKKLKLLLIAAIFFVPYGLAWLVYQNGHRWLAATTNQGELLSEPVSLAKIDQALLQGKWTLLYVLPGKCEQDCQNNLYNIQQVRLAVGKNLQRVERMVLNLQPQKASEFNHWLSTQFKGTKVAYLSKAQWGEFKINDNVPTAGRLYIVDPMGYAIMDYPNGFAANAVFSDLKKLLKASQIG